MRSVPCEHTSVRKRLVTVLHLLVVKYVFIFNICILHNSTILIILFIIAVETFKIMNVSLTYYLFLRILLILYTYINTYINVTLSNRAVLSMIVACLLFSGNVSLITTALSRRIHYLSIDLPKQGTCALLPEKTWRRKTTQVHLEITLFTAKSTFCMVF